MTSGIYTRLVLPPAILGSRYVTEMLIDGFEDLVGASLLVESELIRSADLLEERINQKRTRLLESFRE